MNELKTPENENYFKKERLLMKIASILIIISVICLNFSGCGFPTKKEIRTLENRIERLSTMLAYYLIHPDFHIIMPWFFYIEYVEPEDVAELKKYLEDLARMFKLPKDFDFKKMRSDILDPGTRIGTYWPKPPKGEKRPPRVGWYKRLKDGRFERGDDISGDLLVPPKPPPACGQEFIFSVHEMWKVPNCINVDYQSKFDEMRYRAVKEAILLCSRYHPQECPNAKPTKVWDVVWICKGNLARLHVGFGFVCVGE